MAVVNGGPAVAKPITVQETASSETPYRLKDSTLGRWALVVVALAAILSIVRAFGPLTYAQDIWRQADTATIARNFALHGMNPLLPQVNWGGAGPGYVEAEFQLIPYLSAALYLVFGEHVWIGRLIALVLMLVATAYFWGVVRRRLCANAAAWALIAFAVSPVFMRYGTAFMPEAAVLAFYVGALYATTRWIDEDRVRWLWAMASFVALAGLAKPTSLHIGLVLPVWLAVEARERFRRPVLYLAAVLALVPPALWLWHGHVLYTTYGNTFGVLAGGDDKFGNLTYWLSTSFYTGNARIEIVDVLGVVGLPFAMIGVIALARARRIALLGAGVFGLVIYYFVVARYSESPIGIQYHVFSLPYAAIAVGAGVAWLSRTLAPRLPVVLFRLGAVVLVVALSAASLVTLLRSMTDQSGVYGVCAGQLAQVSQPGDLVVVSTGSTSVDGTTPNNWQEPMIFFMADRRGWSLAADQHEASFLARDVRDGARFFVVYDPSLVRPGGSLDDWLRANAAPLRTATRDGCDIWALDPSVGR